MCPACLASVALVAGSVISTGGVTAIVAKVVSARGLSKPGAAGMPEEWQEFQLPQTNTDKEKENES